MDGSLCVSSFMCVEGTSELLTITSNDCTVLHDTGAMGIRNYLVTWLYTMVVYTL